MRQRTGDYSEAVISWAWISHPAPAPASGTMETPPPARGAQAPNPNQTPLPHTHTREPREAPPSLPAAPEAGHGATEPFQERSGGSPAQSQAGRSPAGQGTPSASPRGTAEPRVTRPGTSRPTGIAGQGDTAWPARCGTSSSGGHGHALMSPQHPGEAWDASVTHRPRATRSHNTAGPAASHISQISQTAHPGAHPHAPAATLGRWCWHGGTGTPALQPRGVRGDDLWGSVPLSRA